jgi:hypothetical protein
MSARKDGNSRAGDDSPLDADEAIWHRGTHCQNNPQCVAESNCAEVARIGRDLVGVRNSRRREVVLRLSDEQFSLLEKAIIAYYGF